jgi:dynein heavy chain 1
VIALFKEVRALIWLGFPVPLTISHRAKDAKRVYPHAVSLMESVRIYSQTQDLVENNPDIAILLASYRSHAQQMISRGGYDCAGHFSKDSTDQCRYQHAVGSSR